jgi:hypothetical protein
MREGFDHEDVLKLLELKKKVCMKARTSTIFKLKTNKNF